MKSTPYVALALAMAIPAILVGVQIPSWFGVATPKMAYQSDLRVFYTPGFMVRAGLRQQIYDFAEIRRIQEQRVAHDNGAVPYLHPAYEALIFAPLSFLSYRNAYLLWAVVNLAILGLICFSLLPYVPDLTALGPSWIAPGLLLGFMPVAFTVLSGQDSLLLLLILVVVFRRIATNELEAGILLGLGMFRFQVLLPIVALFLIWRSLKFVAGWALSSAAVMGLSLAITGIKAQVQYAVLLRQMGSISIWLLLRRMPGMRAIFVAGGLGTIPLLLVYGAIFALAAWLGMRQDPRHRLLLAVLTSTLVTYYLFMHDLSILALPLMVGISESIKTQDWVRASLISLSLAGFSVFWFARDSFYFGVLFTLLFFAVEVLRIWPSHPHISTSTHPAAYAEK